VSWWNPSLENQSQLSRQKAGIVRIAAESESIAEENESVFCSVNLPQRDDGFRLVSATFSAARQARDRKSAVESGPYAGGRPLRHVKPPAYGSTNPSGKFDVIVVIRRQAADDGPARLCPCLWQLHAIDLPRPDRPAPPWMATPRPR
jgi:hypothetical protein